MMIFAMLKIGDTDGIYTVTDVDGDRVLIAHKYATICFTTDGETYEIKWIRDHATRRTLRHPKYFKGHMDNTSVKYFVNLIKRC